MSRYCVPMPDVLLTLNVSGLSSSGPLVEEGEYVVVARPVQFHENAVVQNSPRGGEGGAAGSGR